jgi:hypothetical protein
LPDPPACPEINPDTQTAASCPIAATGETNTAPEPKPGQNTQTQEHYKNIFRYDRTIAVNDP